MEWAGQPETERAKRHHSVSPPLSTRPGYVGTAFLALRSRRFAVLSTLIAAVYVVVFAFAGGMLFRSSSPRVADATGWPHFELNGGLGGNVPYVAVQITESWYLEMNVIQIVMLSLIGAAGFCNAAISGLLLRIRRKDKAAPALLAGAVPFFTSNGACVACAGLPPSMAFVPASLAPAVGGFLAMAQFYGIPALLALIVLGIMALFNLDRATTLRRQNEGI